MHLSLSLPWCCSSFIWCACGQRGDIMFTVWAEYMIKGRQQQIGYTSLHLLLFLQCLPSILQLCACVYFISLIWYFNSSLKHFYSYIYTASVLFYALKDENMTKTLFYVQDWDLGFIRPNAPESLCYGPKGKNRVMAVVYQGNSESSRAEQLSAKWSGGGGEGAMLLLLFDPLVSRSVKMMV